MKTIYNILEYFMPKKFLSSPSKYDKEGNMIISKDEMSSFGKMENYTNWLMSMIYYSQDVQIDIVHLIRLIKSGKMNGLEWHYEQEYILIFLHAIETNEKAFETIFNTNNQDKY